VGMIFSLYGGSSYDEAVEAYRYSRLDEAVSLLLQAKIEEPARDEIHLLLGTVYQKQNQFAEAESTFKEGMALFGVKRDNLIFNLANLYYSQNRKDEALSLYSDLSLGASEYRSVATLNRANCYLSLGDFTQALEDYNSYLTLEPLSSQRSEIERMIALLSQKMADEEERKRLAAEQAAREEARRLEEERLAAQQAALEEAQRQEAERLAAEEAARQQALLDEILASLEGVGGETQVMGAGSEDIVIDDEESDIEE
ncbi:MAG: tetratricopeptide repeat protein, partial [Spirochaetales bacterium]|nr:tetratricopeptide repeat protein [Spirochaetales bacterium]